MPPVHTRVVGLLANLRNNSAPAGRVIYKASVNSCSANERICAIVCVLQRLFLVGRSANDELAVVHVLVTNSMWIQQLLASTVCRAAERHSAVGKGPAEISIKPTAIAIAPKAIRTPYSHWASISRYICCKCATMQYQSKGKEPAEVEKDQQDNLLSSFWKVVVQQLNRRSLYLGKERMYLPRSWWLGTLNPYHNVVPYTL